MQYIKDEELFGAIPQPDGTILRGNADPNRRLRSVISLNGAYRDAVDDCPAMPTGWHFKVTGSSHGENQRRLREMEAKELTRVREAYHKHVDAAIERYMDEKNGFISSYPPAQTGMFKLDNEPVRLDYFQSRPNSFRPVQDSGISRAHAALHSSVTGSVPGLIVCAVVSAILCLGLLLWQWLLDWLPSLGTLLRVDIDTANVVLVVGVALLEIFGCFLLFKLLDVDMDGGFKVLKWILFAAILIAGGIALSLPLEDAQDLPICIGAKWLSTLYFAVITVVYLRKGISLHRAKIAHAQSEPARRQHYIEAFEKEFPAFYRYVRLRQLWFIYVYGENEPLPSWLKSLTDTAERYQALYFQLKNQSSIRK